MRCGGNSLHSWSAKAEPLRIGHTLDKAKQSRDKLLITNNKNQNRKKEVRKKMAGNPEGILGGYLP